jgi:hypothetical protein
MLLVLRLVVGAAVPGRLELLAGQDGAVWPLVFGELLEAGGRTAGYLGGLRGDVVQQSVDQ